MEVLIQVNFVVDVLLLILLFRTHVMMSEMSKSLKVTRQIMNRLIENQRMFSPLIDKVSWISDEIKRDRK